MEYKSYFEVDVDIDTESTVATFYESGDGHFGLRYGGAKYLSRTHDTLEATIADFKSWLCHYYPDQNVVIGQTKKISQDQAESNSQNNRLIKI